MLPYKSTLFGGLLGIVLLLPSQIVLAEEPAEETLARGPLHEGYAEPLEQQPAATPIVPKQPPEPIKELPPDQKPAGDHVVWMPGYWSWDADREDFIWVSGFWRATPPSKVWMPGSWRKVDGGSQWVSGFWSPAQQETAQIQYLPQPPAPLEVGPATPAPTATAIYVPGVWTYRDNRYVWRPGYYIEYKPDWIWIPAHYRWTPAGYVFIDGYWDYALANRGMLFAPAYVPAAVYMRQGYYYTPTVVVREQCVFGALFVRRGYSCYYFGDYFEPRYASVGYVSWNGYSGGTTVVAVRGWYDPMYSYYRVSYRDDPQWRGGMVELYVGRYRGDVPRPPQTLVQQNNIFVNNTTIVNNTTVINNKTVNVNNVQMLTTVTAAAKANPNIKLQPVPTEVRQQHMQAAQQMHVVATQRAQTESKLVTQHGAMPRVNDAPRTAKLEVPKTFANRATLNTNPNATGGNPVDTKLRAIDPKNLNTNPNSTVGNPADAKFRAIDPKGLNLPMSKGIDPKSVANPKVEPKRPAPKHDPKP